jgi:hypothetical protein
VPQNQEAVVEVCGDGELEKTRRVFYQTTTSNTIATRDRGHHKVEILVYDSKSQIPVHSGSNKSFKMAASLNPAVAINFSITRSFAILPAYAGVSNCTRSFGGIGPGGVPGALER